MLGWGVTITLFTQRFLEHPKIGLASGCHLLSINVKTTITAPRDKLTGVSTLLSTPPSVTTDSVPLRVQCPMEAFQTKKLENLGIGPKW